jgi:succinyl-diaminopimelate desuccinylase
VTQSKIQDALVKTLLEITAIPSPIGEEQALCEHLEARFRRTLPNVEMHRFRDSLVLRWPARASLPRVVLAGHLDTVRTSHDGPARIEGDRLYGAGSADMKSGLALMIELAERIPHKQLACALSLVFYAREEGPYEENMLGPILDHFEFLREQDFAICLEPSDNRLQLGCMGSLHATVAFRGRTAHSARPWQGENALYKAIPFLERLAKREPVVVNIEGHIFREVMSPTFAATAGRGRNIVPDQFDINVNYRFAPPKTPEQALEELRALVGGEAEVTATDLSPSGRPHANHPLVKALIDCGVKTVETKQAWTDVARFDRLGVAAVNFGPGTNGQAHQRNEYTHIPDLPIGYEILHSFLTTMPSLR